MDAISPVHLANAICATKNRPLQFGYTSWPSCQYSPHILRNARRIYINMCLS